jgi:hypothetical protein
MAVDESQAEALVPASVEQPKGPVAASVSESDHRCQGGAVTDSEVENSAPCNANGESSRLRVFNCDELLRLDLPPRRYLLHPWLPEKGLAMVYAPRGVGKTLFALGAAYAVACGGRILRFTAPAARRVLYVDGEMPLQEMRDRFAALNAGSEQRPAPDHLRFLAAAPDFWTAG